MKRTGHGSILPGFMCALIMLLCSPRHVLAIDHPVLSTTRKPPVSPTSSLNISPRVTQPPPPIASGNKALPFDILHPVSANPGAVDVISGTGLLGRLIGFSPDSGVRIGGVWIGNSDYLITGGVKPRTWSFNSLLLISLNLDLTKLLSIPGASVDAELLQFNGEAANDKAGAIIGYDGLTGPKPLVRTELYKLWWRQSLFNKKLTLRIGKTVPTYDFNNVSRPIPVEDSSLKIAAVTGLLYTPIFKNPTLIGAAPGYYNSAYGITANVSTSAHSYFSVALYDGALASGVETGLREAPVFNGHYFTIGETGYTWIVGEHKLPGLMAVGGWAQTGELHAPGVKQNGAQGSYAFGSQRLWRRAAGVDNSGISGFFQFGINDSRTMIANEYAGIGLTAFGLIPRRSVDSFGAGLAWSWMNRRYGFRSNEAIIQAYYQMHLIGTAFFQPTLSFIPNPGASPQIASALAITTQVTILF
jgi:porin